jgi:hypothetical protein
MATKIVVSLAVILVLAVLGTAGMMYVNNSLGISMLEDVPAATQPESSGCSANQDEAPPACCRQPKLTPIAIGSCPMQQQAVTSTDSAEK